MKDSFSWEVLESRYEDLMPLFDKSKTYDLNRRLNLIANTAGSLNAVNTYLKQNDNA